MIRPDMHLTEDTAQQQARRPSGGAPASPTPFRLGAALALGIAGSLCATAALAGPPPFPLGVYAGNPNGNNAAAEAAFEARFRSFATTMQATPQFMNAFVDFTQAPSAWPGNAGWTAWSWNCSAVVRTAITPVIGIPMSDNSHWYGWSGSWSSDSFFKGIVAGTYDADYQGIVDAWARAGFHTLYLRLGYEMDGGFMPWFMGADAHTQQDWVAAFQHLATLMRARATADGATAYAVWNPADINWSALPVWASYPGDAYVDVVSSDAYSPLYPTTLYDWSANNWTYDSSIQRWWAQPANQRHFWSYPAANPWNHTGKGSGWGLEDTIGLARRHGKALAVSESGAGGNGTSNGPVDNPAFPTWLAAELGHARAMGVTVSYVNIWDTWMSDGNWAFSMPGDAKPLEAASWAHAFGAASP